MMARNRNTNTNSNNTSNSSNNTQDSNSFDSIARNKSFWIIILVMIFGFVTFILLLAFNKGEEIISDYGDIIFDVTTTASETVKDEIKESEYLSTEPYTNNDKIDHENMISNKLPQSMISQKK